MGVATYLHRKSVSSTLGEHGTFLSLLEIASILSNIPPKTSISYIKQLPVVDLSIRFEVGLHNDMFKEGAEILDDTEWTREIGFSENGKKMYQYNKQKGINLDEVVRKYDEIEEDDEES